MTALEAFKAYCKTKRHEGSSPPTCFATHPEIGRVRVLGVRDSGMLIISSSDRSTKPYVIASEKDLRDFGERP